MRVFDTYIFNIFEKVSFKDTKPYIDNMLRELRYSYNDISFRMIPYNKNHIDKAISKFPALKKYYLTKDLGNNRFEYQLTSYTTNWKSGKIHTDKKDWSEITNLFSKIPRPYNFSDCELILDGINWYDDSDNSISIANWKYGEENYYLIDYSYIYSNRIAQVRHSYDGKKENNIHITIDVTDDNGIRDSKEIIKKLEPYLGKDYSIQRKCVFDKNEYIKFNNLEQVHYMKLKEIGDSILPNSRNMNEVDYKIPLQHIADKATINEAFKGTSFKREKGQINLLHDYSLLDEKGYKYSVFVQKISSCNSFRFSLEISGYNFHIFYQHPDYFVDKEGESLDILKKFAEFCEYTIHTYSNEIQKDFGNTPDWYNVK